MTSASEICWGCKRAIFPEWEERVSRQVEVDTSGIFPGKTKMQGWAPFHAKCVQPESLK